MAATGNTSAWSVLVGLIGFAFLAFIVWRIIPESNTIRLVDLDANQPLFGISEVTAVLHNDGDAIQIDYFVTLGASERPHCPGTTYFSRGERRTLRFNCSALNNFTGTFYLNWSPS